jgi:hypothetical protein
MKLLAVLLMYTASFWETKAPADWTDEELLKLFTDSPWAQMAEAAMQKESHGSGGVQVFLATAGPMQEAEKERQRRYVRKSNRPVVESPMDTEYRLWLEDNHATQIVLAVRVPWTKDFGDAGEVKRMEEESIMRVGRKKYKMTGHFPPTQNDVYLRMAFPRQVAESDKSVVFELYVPGLTPPFRTVEFRVKDMVVKGKLEM